jgi:UPF0716 protein FxsA
MDVPHQKWAVQEECRMKYFLMFIIAMPVVEIIVLLLSGNLIGFWPTLFLIVATGLIGAYLAKRQGMETWKKAQEQIRYGMMPGNEIIDGICIFIGAALLLSPGLISDIMGLILVFPPTRNLLKPIVIRFIMNRMNKGKVTIIRHK